MEPYVVKDNTMPDYLRRPASHALQLDVPVSTHLAS